MASQYRTDDIPAGELTPEQKAAEFEAGQAAALERQKDPAVAEHVAKLRAREASKVRGSVTADPSIFSIRRKAN